MATACAVYVVAKEGLNNSGNRPRQAMGHASLPLRRYIKERLPSPELTKRYLYHRGYSLDRFGCDRVQNGLVETETRISEPASMKDRRSVHRTQRGTRSMPPPAGSVTAPSTALSVPSKRLVSALFSSVSRALYRLSLSSCKIWSQSFECSATCAGCRAT